MLNLKQNIRIEEVGDIVYSKYNFLEVFYRDNSNPFLDIGINEDDKQLSFKFYANEIDVILTLEDLERILQVSKEFLPEAIKNEEDFEKYWGSEGNAPNG